MPIQSTDLDNTGDGFDYGGDDETYVINAGVDVMSEGANGIGTSFTLGVAVNNGVLSADGNGIYDNGTGSQNTFVTNASGLIVANVGMKLFGNFDYVDNYGRIIATHEGIILGDNGGSIYNSGNIDSARASGISLEGGGNISVVNSGSVIGGTGGIISSAANFVTITNSGGISLTGNAGDAILSSGADQLKLTNTGSIVGGVSLADQAETLRNRGTIEGNVEFKQGAATFDGRGGAVSGTISGSAAADTFRLGNDGETVDSRGGHDTIYSGAGADTFVYASTSAADSDTIHGFGVANDRIELDHHAFTKLTAGTRPIFAIASAATSASDHLFYNGASGNLFYDVDGNGAAHAPVLIAKLDVGLKLTAGDFIVV